MVFVEDAELKQRLIANAMASSPSAKQGKTIALALTALAPVGFFLGSFGCAAVWGDSYEYDPSLAVMTGGLLAFFCLVAAFVIYRTTRITASRPITQRVEQQAFLEDGQLTVLYRNRGDVSVYGRVMIVINLDETSFSMDPRTGLITFHGDVQEGFVHVNHGEISALTEFSQIGTQVVANCFTPNLYQELIQYVNGRQ